ncbi:MAG: hypothetical protein QG597_4602 [Actinomycetota bacterium]|nr:hypothetical protein [Actinomycetota bacterium]
MVPRIALLAGSGVIVLLAVAGCASQSAPPTAPASMTTAVASSAPHPATSSGDAAESTMPPPSSTTAHGGTTGAVPTASSTSAPATSTPEPLATAGPSAPSSTTAAAPPTNAPATTTPAATAPIVLPASDLPTPAATLPNAQAPAASAGVATADPVALPQYVPPDISQSGIAISVAGTRYTPGQTIATSSQAAPELTGFTSYLLLAGQHGTITPVATGTVGPAGRFTLSFRPDRPCKLISAVAQAGITPTDSFNLDNVIARSSVVTINTD